MRFGKIIVIYIILLLLTLIFSEQAIIDYGYWTYLIQLAAVTIFIYKKNNNYLYFFSPAFLALAYLNLSFFGGHGLLVVGSEFVTKYHDAFNGYSSVKFITVFFTLCNLVVSLTISEIKLDEYHEKPVIQNFNIFRLIALLLFLIIFSSFKIDLALIGGRGDFSYVFKLAISIFIIITVKQLKIIWRIISYLIMLSLFVIGSFDSKREILFVFILIVFYEIVSHRLVIKFRFKQVLLIIAAFTSVFYIIIISSIMRGYGNFNVEDPLEASTHVIEYVTSDYAVFALSANFEIFTVYGNSSNALNYVYNEEVDLLYGSTFAKVLFVPIPRSVFPDKPESMVNIYTQKFQPSFRGIGGSLPVVIYGEVFWNFHIFGLIFLFILFKVVHQFYKRLVLSVVNGDTLDSWINIFYLFLYATFIQFVRGAGLELWLLYAAITIPFVVVLNNVFKNSTN
ncbi:hypothetical protein [Nonlabens sp.]|uniref:hypothetical protein n=1 Tax=Nonlabens sp. TaxID=1888209 RepID=UPI0032633193